MGISAADLTKALHAARLGLKVEIGAHEVSFRQLGVTFGCLHAPPLAQTVLDTYTHHARISSKDILPMHRVASFALVCRALNVSYKA